MSRDLFLKTVRKNWARGSSSELLPPLKPVVDTASRLSPPLTAAERKRVGEIAVVRTKAESGDPAARKEWRRISTAVVGLRVRAKGGDPRAVRACQVLEETGVFGRTQKVTVSGAGGAGRGSLLASSASSQLRSRQAAPPQSSDDDSGSVVESLLGEFVGDEDRTAREAGRAEREAADRVRGTYTALGQWGGRGGRRRRHLRRMVERSVRGDAAATARLQQVTAKLTQRAQAGDQRAAALLQQVQSWTSTYQSRLTASPNQATTYPPQPYAAPVAPQSTPYSSPYAAAATLQATSQPASQPVANVNYPAPAFRDDYDDSFGAEKRNTGEVDDY